MHCIEILQAPDPPSDVSIKLDHKYCGGEPMKYEFPSPKTPSYCQEDIHAPSSRLTDEKISDDSGAETTIDSALKPAGLKNPFWK
jgi:hypothetical protein